MKTEWLEMAKKASSYACCQYSHFKVGACLITKQGKIYTGCNIENQGIMSICAERVAFAKALSEGEKEFEAIAVVGKSQDGNWEETLPCGYCRQFLLEYGGEELKVITQNRTYSLKELLPFSFGFKK